MKVTPQIIEFTHQKLKHYITLTHVPQPILAVRTREILDMPLKYTKGRRTSAYKYWGVCYQQANTLFINIKRHKSRKEIDNTVAHEIIHLRYPYLAHGEKFEIRVEKLQKGIASKPPKHKYVDMWKDNR